MIDWKYGSYGEAKIQSVKMTLCILAFRVSLSMAMHLTWWKIHTEIDNRCRRNVIVEKMWRNIGLRNRGNSILVAIYSLLISTFCLFSDAADFT